MTGGREFLSATNGDGSATNDHRAQEWAVTGAATALGGVATVPGEYNPGPIRYAKKPNVQRTRDGRTKTSAATEQLSTPVTAQEQPSARFSYRWVASMILCSTAGLGVLAVADDASRREILSIPTYHLFWLGVLLIFVPIAVRTLATDVNPRERMTLIVFLGLALYLVKILFSPYDLTFVDEYVHERNTHAILSMHHLFTWNPLLETAAYYPGLSALTAGVVALTGFSLFAAALLVVGIARFLVCAFFYLIFESVTHSGRGAAAASLIYMANPMFLFWSSTFTYENLALPLGAFVVWWIGKTRNRGGLTSMVVAVAGIIAVTVTHHVVGFALAGLLVAWWLAERFGCHATKATRRQVGILAIVAWCATLTWFFVVATPAPTYLLTNNLLAALQNTISVLRGHTAPRQLYVSSFVAPAWEQMAGFAAVFVLLAALPFGLLRARWSWRRAPVAVAAALAISYPLSLVPRFAPNGVNVSGRSSEYVYAGLGCVIGLLVTVAASRWNGWRASGPGEHDGRRDEIGVRGRTYSAGKAWRDIVIPTSVATVLATVVFVGNVTVGTRYYERLPERANPHGYERTLQPDVIAASKWALEHLGPNQMFGANAIDSWGLVTYGDQDLADARWLWQIFFARSVNSDVVKNIKRIKLRYVLVNWRMTRAGPVPDFYIHTFEPEARHYLHAFPASGLEKFSSDPCIGLIYDAGPIQIYDVSQIESDTCP